MIAYDPILVCINISMVYKGGQICICRYQTSRYITVILIFFCRGLGELQMPKIFGRPVRNALKADPVHVNLVEQDPRFFAFGGKFLEAYPLHMFMCQFLSFN